MVKIYIFFFTSQTNDVILAEDSIQKRNYTLKSLFYFESGLYPLAE